MPIMVVEVSHPVYNSSPAVDASVDIESVKSAAISNEKPPSGPAIVSYFFALQWNRLREKFHTINESPIRHVFTAGGESAIENTLLKGTPRQKRILLVGFEIKGKTAIPLYLDEKASLT